MEAVPLCWCSFLTAVLINSYKPRSQLDADALVLHRYVRRVRVGMVAARLKHNSRAILGGRHSIDELLIGLGKAAGMRAEIILVHVNIVVHEEVGHHPLILMRRDVTVVYIRYVRGKIFQTS